MVLVAELKKVVVVFEFRMQIDIGSFELTKKTETLSNFIGKCASKSKPLVATFELE